MATLEERKILKNKAKKEIGSILRHISRFKLDNDNHKKELENIADNIDPSGFDDPEFQKINWTNEVIEQNLLYCMGIFIKYNLDNNLRDRLKWLISNTYTSIPKIKEDLKVFEKKIEIKHITEEKQKIEEKSKSTLEEIKQKKEEIKQKEIKQKIEKISKVIVLNKILIIGPSIAESCHFSEGIKIAFEKLGKEVKYISPHDLYDEYFDRHWMQQKHYPLSIILQKYSFYPDLILIDECNFLWKNDVSIPVFYHHREYKRPPEVDYPDVIFLWHGVVMNYFEKIFAPFWMYNVPYHEIIPLAIDTEIYHPEEKKYDRITGIGFRETIEYIEKANEITMVPIAHILYNEWEEFKKLGFRCFDTPISNIEYREILPKCEALFVNIATQQYLSHKIYETMACKTLCIIKLENETHKQILENAGFIAGKHYIAIKALNEIKEVYDQTQNKQEIVENAYKKILKDNTYIENAKYITKLFFKLTPNILKNRTIEYKNDPGDLNILISTTERCGLSWFCRYVSLIYEKMYKKRKVWNTRISRLEVAHPDYPSPKGWNAVNYVPIKDIVKKPHDRIILLQRKFESWKESMLFYYYNEYKPNLDYKTDKDNPEYKVWFDRIAEYYNQTYDEIDSPKVLRIYIEDLNNYTVATFTEIFNFLDFPKEGRPIIIPVNTPERVWEAFSADFNAGDLINERLQKLHSKYSNTKLEFKTNKKTITPAIDYITTEETEGYETTPMEKEMQKGETFTMNPFLTTIDTLKILDKEKFDVICPVYWINTDFFVDNVKSWIKEIPVKRIIFGINRSIKDFDFEEVIKYKIRPIIPPNIEIQVIDQRKYKTLGMCLVELMKLVQNWFVFVHSDVRLTKGSFRVMQKHAKPDIGIIESERIFFDGKTYKRGKTHYTKRSYSGFQLIQKESIKDLIDEIEDDFIYRNEDLIFQSRCKQNGFKYKKVWAWHVHQILETKQTFNEKDTMFMQWHGLVKYTQPDEITKEVCWAPIEVCLTKWGQVLSQILAFTWQHNPNWGELIIEKWNQYKIGKVRK